MSRRVLFGVAAGVAALAVTIYVVLPRGSSDEPKTAAPVADNSVATETEAPKLATERRAIKPVWTRKAEAKAATEAVPPTRSLEFLPNAKPDAPAGEEPRRDGAAAFQTPHQQRPLNTTQIERYRARYEAKMGRKMTEAEAERFEKTMAATKLGQKAPPVERVPGTRKAQAAMQCTSPKAIAQYRAASEPERANMKRRCEELGTPIPQ